MRSYKYREHEYALKVLGSGFQTSHYGRELRLAATYLREVFGMDRAAIRRRLCDLCQKYLRDYNEARHYSVINYAVREAMKPDARLISISEIPIYEGELLYIDSLPVSRGSKKVMLAMLVSRKLSKAVYERKRDDGTPYTNMCFGGGRAKYTELKKMSCIPQSTDIHTAVIAELAGKKLVNILHNGLISLDWIYNTAETGELMLSITDFANTGLYYDRYKGDTNIKECSVCGGLYRLRTNNQRYCCADCATEADLEKARQRSRMRRMKNVG